MTAPAIEIEGLTKRYRHRMVLRGVDLQIPAGQVYGLVGLNGAGKTTLLRCIVGFARPTSGTIRVLGQPVPMCAAAVLARSGVLVEAPGFYPFLSGPEVLAELLVARGGHRDPERVGKMLARTGLECSSKRVGSYSKGMTLRLALAAALLFDPELVVLDEPTDGLDPIGVRDLRHLLLELKAEGRTVVLSSHALGEVEAVADVIGMLHEGVLLSEATPAEMALRIPQSEAAVGTDLERAFLSMVETEQQR